MSRVTQEDFEQAALWLDECDASPAMREACLRVAEWVRAEAQRREREVAIRAVSRETGLAPSQVRARLAAAGR